MNISNFKKTLPLGPNLTVTVERIAYIEGSLKLIAISNSAFYAVYSLLDDEFNLPQIYAGLTYLTGPGDDKYDDYKGSFSFTFKLNVKKPEYETEYIYRVVHYRSYIEFFVHEIVAKDDPRDEEIMHSPNDKRFSDKDIRMFSACFLKFAVMYIENQTIKPFVKSSDSNLILFGYKNNKYFHQTYQEHEEYHEQKRLLQEEIQLT
jgi:hypothetical protein